ncbi:MAG: biopolymer transporter ExbD [Bacteroidetes bacterium]|nr:MAG: biopolymer transporter ExbD [Bacteroidota bacterium]
MAMKRNSKVSAEFSMSSLTDIIFLLLIFFMLTSSLTTNAPHELPESDAKTVAPVSVRVAVNKQGVYSMEVNGSRQVISKDNLIYEIRKQIAQVEDSEELGILIEAEVGTPFEKITELLGLAAALKVQAVLATKPKPS